ncbi:unnamed protein product [Vicia faba]|uniref:Uncharacterized protein n=1 Tax=Vicia faba TaxID=3906 RepID=A0AAV0ZQ02_VICFA|nr:unnamed protein product [Vicia faba]
MARNTSRFQDKIIPFKSICSLIFAHVTCLCSNTNLSYKGCFDAFSTIKAFTVTIHPLRVFNIKKVIWVPPLLNWIKCNVDRACIQNPPFSCSGGIFRDGKDLYILAYVEPICSYNSMVCEFCTTICCIEISI